MPDQAHAVHDSDLSIESQPLFVAPSWMGVGPPLEEAAIITIDMPTPGARLAGGRLHVAGWILSAHPLAAVSILLDGNEIGAARHGIFRRDVALAHPEYRGADHSGFDLTAEIPADRSSAGEGELTVVATMLDGTTHRRMLPVVVEAVETPDRERLPSRPGLVPLMLHVDTALLQKEEIRVSGWVVACQSIVAVQAFAGDEWLGNAALGRHRPDIEAILGDYPNAATSGFEIVVAPPVGIEQIKVLRVEALSSDGSMRQMIAPLVRQDGGSTIAAAQAGCEHHCDELLLTTDGALLASGWVSCHSGITSIDVWIDGEVIGRATHPVSRPDVAAAFPAMPGAAWSGFVFSRHLARPFDGVHRLRLAVRTGDGSVHIIALGDVRAIPGPPPAPAEPAEEVRLVIDEPSGGAGSPGYTGGVTIAGWALARGGVAAIDILIDGTPAGEAYYGVRREDVSRQFPDWPDSLMCGYAYFLPLRGFLPGSHRVTVFLRCQDGQTRQAEAEFTVGVVEDRENPGHLRLKMSQAETDIGLAVVAAVAEAPRFVIVMPWAPGEEVEIGLAETLATLEEQVYADWSVLLVPADGVAAPGVATMPDIPATCSARVAMACRHDGEPLDVVIARHVDGATLVAYLAPGDLLGCDALLEMSMAAAFDADVGLFYSDERRLNPVSGRCEAYFKGGWSPDLLLSANYIGRFWCVRFGILAATSTMASGIGIGAEYDFVLRCTEQSRAVKHIPKVLCQRGPLFCESPDQERAALAAALARRGMASVVLPGLAPSSHRVRREAAALGRVSIIIPTIAARGLIETCINSIRSRTSHSDYEIVILDNIPDDESPWKAWLRQVADKIVELREPFNWSRFNNIAAAQTEGEYLLFLNDDVEVLEPDWLEALLEHAQRQDVGVVGPLLLYPDRKVQHAGLFLSRNGGARHAFRYLSEDDPGYFGLAQMQRNVIGVTGACMLMRRAVFDALGGFDEAHSVINNDLDFCLRVHSSGLLTVYTPFAKLVHHELASRALLEDEFDAGKFGDRWGSLFLEGDPFYSPHLSLDSDGMEPNNEPLRVIHASHPLIARERVRNILAVKLDHIGDFVTALPALRRIKARFPGAVLHVLCSKAAMLLRKLEPCIDVMHEFEFFHPRSSLGRKALDEADYRALQARMLPHGFDIAIDLRKQTDTREILRYVGARWLAGFDHGGEFRWLDIAMEWEGDRRFQSKRQHVGEDYVSLVELVSANCEPLKQFIEIDRPHAQAEISRILGARVEQFFGRAVVCVHPAAGAETKQWPIRYFAQLVDLLVAEENVNVILIGAADEGEIASAVIELLHHRRKVLNLVGRLPLGDLPTVLRACSLFVGNDSGPKHIAAALGIPTVGIHSGVVDAHEWGPLGPKAVAIRRDMSCSPCYLAQAEDCRHGLACLTRLPVNDVYRQCRRLLALA